MGAESCVSCAGPWHIFFLSSPIQLHIDLMRPTLISVRLRFLQPCLSSFNTVSSARPRTTLADTPLLFLFQNEYFVTLYPIILAKLFRVLRCCDVTTFANYRILGSSESAESSRTEFTIVESDTELYEFNNYRQTCCCSRGS